jgi:hypothetical protein
VLRLHILQVGYAPVFKKRSERFQDSGDFADRLFGAFLAPIQSSFLFREVVENSLLDGLELVRIETLALT